MGRAPENDDSTATTVDGPGSAAGGGSEAERAREAELAELRRTIRDIAHDLNNYLSTIGGACRMMQLEGSLSGATKADLEEIERATHRATALSRTLSALGRTHTHGLPAMARSLEQSPFARREPAAEPPPVAAAGDPGSVTVLLVDDEAGARRVVERMLQVSGYRVLCARDGQEALRLSEEHPEGIALLLSDVMMPGMDGVTLFRLLRQRHGSLRALFVSGYTDATIGQALVDERGVAFLAKPFLMEALLAEVRGVLGEGET